MVAMRLSELVDVSRAVAESSSRLRKIELLADLLKRVPLLELEAAVGFLSGSPRQGRIGIGGAALSDARSVTPSDLSSLELIEVDRAFERFATLSGSGSAA